MIWASGQLGLLRTLPSISSDEGRRIRAAYEQAAHRLTSAYPLRSRAADLQLSARRCGADLLADRVGRIGIPLPWATRWAWWSRTGAHRQLSGHTETVQCVATANLDGRPIAVTGGWDKTARVWDLITQQHVGKPLPVGTQVSSVAIGDLDDYTIALAGGVDGVVSIWDLSAGQEYGASLTGHTNRINAIAVRDIGNRPMALTASGDGTARIWDLSTRRQIGPALTAHRRTVRTAALGELDGRPIAVTGGDDRRLYIWDLSSLAAGGDEVKVDGRPLIGATDAVSAVALGRRHGHTVAVVGDDAGALSVWDLADRQQVGEPVVAHVYHQAAGVRSAAIGTIGGSQVVLTSGGKDVRLWDLDGLRQRGHPLRGHVGPINAAALTPGDDRPMAVTVSADRTARVWDLKADQPAAGHVHGVLAIAFAKAGSQPLALTGGRDGTARLWDLRSRKEIGRPMEGHAGEVLAVALCSLGGNAVAVTGGSDATVRLWDPIRGEPLGVPLEGHTNAVRCLQIIVAGGRSIAITGSADGTIRLWDIASQRPLGSPLAGHIGEISHLAARYGAGSIEIVAATKLDHVYLWRIDGDNAQAQMDAHLDLYSVDKTARALSVSAFHGQAIVLAAQDDNSVRVYEVRTGEFTGKPLIGHKSYVLSASAEQRGPETMVATIGYDGVRLWDLAAGRQQGEPMGGDVREHTAFVFAEVDSARAGLVAFETEFRMCALPSLHPIGEPLCGNDDLINAVSIVPNMGEAMVVTGGEDGALRMHALADGSQPVPHVTGATPVATMAARQVGERLYAVVARYTGTEVWNLASREFIGMSHGSGSPTAVITSPTCLVLCPIEERIAVLTGRWHDPDILITDLLTGAPIDKPLSGHTAGLTDLSARIVAEVPLAASASLDGTVRLWDLRIRQPIGNPLEGHVLGARAVALGEFDDRNVVLTGAGDGRIRMWDLATLAPVDIGLEAHPDEVAAVRLEKLGGRSFAITADVNGLVRAWDLRAETCRAEVNVGSGINDISLTPIGELCVATNMGVVALQLNPDTDTRGA
jgi:WD40 repeat protein